MNAGTVMLLLIVITAFAVWGIYNVQQKGKFFSSGTEAKSTIKVFCKNGFMIGYYIEGDLFKGKKYINSKLAADGIFFNGVQVGLGREYHENGKLKYIGHFLNGYAAGSGKLFNEDGRLKYEGNFENGYASGIGKLYDNNGHLKCEGNFARLSIKNESQKDPSAPSGKCREYYENGKVKYAGDFYNGLWHGDGKYYDKSGRLLHRGRFLYGKPVK